MQSPYTSNSVLIMMTVDVLQALFGKSRNEIYAGHVLATRRQHLPLCSTVCTATNETPHGAFLVSLDNPILVPATPGPVYMRRQVRANKTKPGRTSGNAPHKPSLRPRAVSWRQGDYGGH